MIYKKSLEEKKCIDEKNMDIEEKDQLIQDYKEIIKEIHSEKEFYLIKYRFSLRDIDILYKRLNKILDSN